MGDEWCASAVDCGGYGARLSAQLDGLLRDAWPADHSLLAAIRFHLLRSHAHIEYQRWMTLYDVTEAADQSDENGAKFETFRQLALRSAFLGAPLNYRKLDDDLPMAETSVIGPSL